MLRLRAYEKLQNLVARGVVKKTGKIYKGDSSALAAMTAANTAQAAADRLQSPSRNHTPMLQDYLPILLQVIVAIGFAAVALLTSVVLGRVGKRNAIKDSAYECGMLPLGGGSAAIQR